MVSQVRLIISGLRQLFDQVIDHQSNKERKAKNLRGGSNEKRIDKKDHTIE